MATLDVAGISLSSTKSPDWLAVLEEPGPTAVGGVAQGPLPDTLCEQVLNNSLGTLHAERVNRDLLAFIEGEQHLAAPLGRVGVL
jgi:hypothetical protein